MIKVNRGVQDRHSWRPSKAHVGPIISFFLPIGFFLLASFEYTYHLIQMSSSIEMKSLAYGIVIFMPPYVQVKLTGLLGPVGFLVCKRVYFVPKSPLSAAPYSMAPLALADESWSLICSFSIIFYSLEKGAFINGPSSSCH